MVATELDAMRELHAALVEERGAIALSVAKLRGSRRLKGTLLPGDGADAGPRFLAIQQQIDAVEAVIAALGGQDV